jgi:hypothetical protein
LSSFDNLVNWNNVFQNSEKFQKNKPVPFGFVEEFFDRAFYEKLYKSWPTEDGEGWVRMTADYSRSASHKYLIKEKKSNVIDNNDPNMSKEWNVLKQYVNSPEFVAGIAKYTGLPLTKLVTAVFATLFKGDFNMVHNHFEESGSGDYAYKVTMMLYFSKSWQKGDPGGTYIASEEDESSIVFEPCNLDNTMLCFQETPSSWHGSRIITKDVVRRAFTLTLN